MPGFNQKLELSPALAKLCGQKNLERTKIVKKIWAHIKKNNLQDSKDRRQINNDQALREIFGRQKMGMMEMNSLLSKSVKQTGGNNNNNNNNKNNNNNNNNNKKNNKKNSHRNRNNNINTNKNRKDRQNQKGQKKQQQKRRQNQKRSQKRNQRR